MERILRFFGKEYGEVNQAALLLGLFAFLSQILGLFRDRFITHFIGPSPELDAYYAAFRIPDLIFLSIASLASVTVIIPMIMKKMQNGQISPESRKFIDDVFTVFFFALVLVSIVIFILMPYLGRFLVPGFNIDMQSKMILLSRIMLLSPILLGLSNLFGAVTQLFRKFFIYALSPIFYNLGIIIGIVFFYPIFGIIGLALGVVLGAFMHFLIQVVTSYSCGFNLRFSRSVNLSDIRKLVLISLPRTLGLSLNNISLIVIISLASFLKHGSISIFNLSLNLQTVPLGIIGLSYAVAAFPALTESFNVGKLDIFKSQLKETARQIVFWSLPIAVIFIVLRAQIVRVILGSSTFSWENTRLVAASLAIFSLSIVAQGLIALFARAYYAGGRTKRPLMINFISSFSIVILSMTLLNLFHSSDLFRNFIESLLKVSDIPGTDILMLPLAYSLGTILNCTLLWFFIKKDFMRHEQFIFKTFFQSLVASFVIGIIGYVGLNIFSPIFGTVTFWGVFLQGLISGVFGVCAGVLVLYLMKSEELRDLIFALKSKFWKKDIVAQNTETL